MTHQKPQKKNLKQEEVKVLDGQCLGRTSVPAAGTQQCFRAVRMRGWEGLSAGQARPVFVVVRRIHKQADTQALEWQRQFSETLAYTAKG